RPPEGRHQLGALRSQHVAQQQHLLRIVRLQNPFVQRLVDRGAVQGQQRQPHPHAPALLGARSEAITLPQFPQTQQDIDARGLEAVEKGRHRTRIGGQQRFHLRQGSFLPRLLLLVQSVADEQCADRQRQRRRRQQYDAARYQRTVSPHPPPQAGHQWL